MVQDAGLVPDMQTEITLGEDIAQNSDLATKNPGDNSKEGVVATGADVLLPLNEANLKKSGRNGRSRSGETSGLEGLEEGRRTRSSRSSQKKLDPDFCYDDPLVFTGNRKRTASNKSPVNFSVSPVSSPGGKRVALESDSSKNRTDFSSKGKSHDSYSVDNFPGELEVEDERGDSSGEPDKVTQSEEDSRHSASPDIEASPDDKGNMSTSALPVFILSVVSYSRFVTMIMHAH